MSALSFDELRDMAIVVSELAYDEELYESIPYDQQRIIRDKLNREFDRRIGESLQIYNMMDKKFNKEKWNGDCRYHLLTLHNRKGYGEMTALKNTIWFMKMKGQTIDISTAFELEQVMTNGLFWEFDNEVHGVSFDESSEKFAVYNEGRNKEIKTQNDFVQYVFDDNFENAYKMIQKQVDKIMNRQ